MDLLLKGCSQSTEISSQISYCQLYASPQLAVVTAPHHVLQAESQRETKLGPVRENGAQTPSIFPSSSGSPGFPGTKTGGVGVGFNLFLSALNTACVVRR